MKRAKKMKKGIRGVNRSWALIFSIFGETSFISISWFVPASSHFFILSTYEY